MLVGDSMAKSLSEGFVLAAGNLGMKSMIFSMPGCPFLTKDSPVVSNEVCSPWRANVANAINVVKPDILVISNLGSLYIDILGQTYSGDEAKQIWSNEMARTISQSVSQLKAVLIVQPPPRFVQDVKYDISLLRTISKREPRPDVIARRIVANEIERNLLDPAKANLGLLNFDDVFCNESDCSQVIGNQLMFEDADHLSPQGSRLLVDQIETKMKEVLGR
jgi:lysophospholipase L1-like esterase